jgi:hypothetical protein
MYLPTERRQGRRGYKALVGFHGRQGGSVGCVPPWPTQWIGRSCVASVHLLDAFGWVPAVVITAPFMSVVSMAAALSVLTP